MDREKDTIRLNVVGDVFLNRPEPAGAFDGVRSMLSGGDIVIANLEGGFGRSADPLPHAGVHLRMPASSAAALGEAGIDLVSLANNHAMDFGAAGMTESLDVLSEAGIDVVGAGRDREAAEAPVRRVNDGITVGVVAYEATPLSYNIAMQAAEDRAGMNVILVRPDYPEHVSEYDLRRMKATIQQTAASVDVLLAFIHFGAAVDHTISSSQRVIAESAVDAGADMVLGAHPHVLQAVDVYRSAPICYSLGHFLFDSLEYDLGLGHLNQFPAVADLSVLTEVEASTTGIESVRLRPVVIDDFDPRCPEPGSNDFRKVEELLVDISERDGTPLIVRDDHLRPPL